MFIGNKHNKNNQPENKEKIFKKWTLRIFSPNTFYDVDLPPEISGLPWKNGKIIWIFS